MSDNGRQFTSAEFARFCAEFSLVHLRTAPGSPMSNGQAERMVRTVKAALEDRAEALDTVVATYNYTPSAVLQARSPAEIFSAGRSGHRSTCSNQNRGQSWRN